MSFSLSSHYTHIQAIVLAAGSSSRFCTSSSKLSFTICGQELIIYPLRALEKLSIPTTIVIGHQKEKIKEIITKNISIAQFVVQEKQLGTGHAVICSKDHWNANNILILNGDAPLVDEQLINELIDRHINQEATITFVSAYNAVKTNGAYGRIVIKNDKMQIVEAKEFGDLKIEDYPYINAGIYLVNQEFLTHAIDKLAESHNSKNSGKIDNKKREFYITDLIEIASQSNKKIVVVETDFNKVRGINTLQELYLAETVKKTEIISHWMAKGVRFIDPSSVQIDISVTLEPDTIIEAGVYLKGKTSIGRHCKIEPYAIIKDSIIHDFAQILSHSVIENSVVHAGAQVGPFARLRKDSSIGAESVIGNFVEVSQSNIANQTKAKHLAYLGTSNIGSKVNIGAGVITCNYNGFNKNLTHILDEAFVGSNSALIAPVTIGKSSIIGAGSVITTDIPENALALTRADQTVKPNYASELKEKYKQKKEAQNTKSDNKNIVTTNFKPKNSNYETAL